MFKKLSEQLKANPRTIVFTEGTDARILEAADKLTAEGVLGVILLGKADEVKAAAKETGFNVRSLIRNSMLILMRWLMRW